MNSENGRPEMNLSPSYGPSAEVLFVADLLQPLDIFAVQGFLNGDVSHRGFVRGAVPVFLARRTGDDIAGADFLFRLTPALRPAKTAGDDQGLAARMRVPGAARAGLECDAGTA